MSLVSVWDLVAKTVFYENIDRANENDCTVFCNLPDITCHEKNLEFIGFKLILGDEVYGERFFTFQRDTNLTARSGSFNKTE